MLFQSGRETMSKRTGPTKNYDWSKIIKLSRNPSNGFVEIRSHKVIICGSLKRIWMKKNKVCVEVAWAAKAEMNKYGLFKTRWNFLNEGKPLILLEFENFTYDFTLKETSYGRVINFGKGIHKIYLDYCGYLKYDAVKFPRKHF